MSPNLANANELASPSSSRHNFSALAVSSTDPGAEWVAVVTEYLPRQAFELVVAFGRAFRDGDALHELVSLRNALKRDGKLLVVIGVREAWGDLRALVAEAGFTRIRELASDDHGSWTLELQR